VLVYLVAVFFIVPLIVFCLSAAGRDVLPAVLAFLGFVAVCAGVLTVFQRHRPGWLPAALRSWDWLPMWMRSLEPADRLIVGSIDLVRRACRRAGKESAADDTTAQPALTADATAGLHSHDGLNQATSTTASLLSWIPLLKHNDGESGYASVATTPAPSRFPSNAFLQAIEDADNDDEQSASR